MCAYVFAHVVVLHWSNDDDNGGIFRPIVKFDPSFVGVAPLVMCPSEEKPTTNQICAQIINAEIMTNRSNTLEGKSQVTYSPVHLNF